MAARRRESVPTTYFPSRYREGLLFPENVLRLTMARATDDKGNLENDSPIADSVEVFEFAEHWDAGQNWDICTSWAIFPVGIITQPLDCSNWSRNGDGKVNVHLVVSSCSSDRRSILRPDRAASPTRPTSTRPTRAA
jgi:hypothetical protein